MSKTITIDIIDDQALNLLVDLERLKLIRLRRDRNQLSNIKPNTRKYKGSISKQSIQDVDKQLTELREGWD